MAKCMQGILLVNSIGIFDVNRAFAVVKVPIPIWPYRMSR